MFALSHVISVVRVVLLTLALLPAQNEQDREFRFRFAEAVVSATSDIHEQNVLASIARYESNYIERIAAPNCDCKKNECDGGKAKGSWQIHARSELERSQLCVSLEDDARIALERIRESERGCGNLPENERLAIYARGRCSSEEGRKLSRIRWIK